MTYHPPLRNKYIIHVLLHLADPSVIPQVFLNIVLDDAVEEKAGGEKVRMGMVVSSERCIRIAKITDSDLGDSRKLCGHARGKRRLGCLSFVGTLSTLSTRLLTSHSLGSRAH